MNEIWATLEEFPNYQISSLGRVANNDTGRILKHSKTRGGVVKIGMVIGGIQYTRSVAMMVAHSFVEGETDIFDTPIHLDGDQSNNSALNLMWRPRWFALKYTRQFARDTVNKEAGPVYDIDKHERYDSVLHAGCANGLLLVDIWKSIHYGFPTFPTQQRFGFGK